MNLIKRYCKSRDISFKDLRQGDELIVEGYTSFPTDDSPTRIYFPIGSRVIVNLIYNTPRYMCREYICGGFCIYLKLIENEQIQRYRYNFCYYRLRTLNGERVTVL
jgi:hypothetical protein